MAFPQTKLPITVELQINGVWTDVSTDVRSQGGTDAIRIQRGITASGGVLADKGTCSLTLDNNSGAYSSRNPRSPYFGYLGRNTPLRVGVAYGTPWLDVPVNSSVVASTPDAAVLDVAGDIDIRVDAELPTWGDPAGTSDYVDLISKYGLPGNRAWFLGVDQAARLVFFWSADGTNLLSAASAALPFYPRQRGAVRVTLDVDNGASGNTVTFYTSTTAGTAGPWTQLGSPVVQSGTTSLVNSSAPLEVGRAVNATGMPTARKYYAAEVRNGIGGTIVANPNFEAQTAGATSFTDTAPSARTWSVPAGGLTNVFRRFVGEVSEWPPQWDTGGKDVTTPITASGILRRYGQSRTTLQSTLRRRLSTASGLLAYWPMEDSAGSTQAASPLPGASPMRASGLNWASDSSLAGSAALPQLAPPSSLFGVVPATAAGDWHVEMVYKLDTLPAAPTVMFQVNVAGGTAATVQFLVGVAVARIQALDSNGTVIQSFDGTPTAFTDNWGRLQIYTSTSGGTTSVYGQWFVIGGPTSTFVFASYLGAPGRVSSVTGSWGSAFADLRIGHIAAMPRSVALAGDPFNGADQGFDGETAAARLTRVALEQGLPMSVAARAADTELVGPQAQDTLLNVLTAGAQADEGLLHEAREFLGLRFRGRRSLENQPSALDLPYVATPQALMAPLTPVDDDQATLNDSTVTRTGGSSTRAEVTTGPLSTQPPPAGVGTGYDESVTLNLHSDDQTWYHAWWRVFLGTWDEARFPQVNISLEKNPALIPAAARIDTGSRIRITAPLPTWLPPDAIDQLVLGYAEVIAQFSWRLSMACRPYGPYRTGVLDDAVLGRLDTDGSSLAAAATSTATTLSVAVTAGPLWTTDPAEYPFDLRVGGEVVTARAAGAPVDLVDGTFESGVSGWTPTNATFVSSNAQARTGSKSGLLTVVGSPTSAQARPDSAHYAPVTVGAQYRCSLWVYAPVTPVASVSVSIDWLDSSKAFLSGVGSAAVSVPVGVWTLLTLTATAPASAAYLRSGPTISGSPATGTQLYVDDMATVPTSTYTASPQSLAVIRSVNGVSKAQVSGTAVALNQPLILAL